MTVFQITTAAASGGTFGFNAALELDVDVLEKEFASYKETSVGSNLSASNISIRRIQVVSAPHLAELRGNRWGQTRLIYVEAV